MQERSDADETSLLLDSGIVRVELRLFIPEDLYPLILGFSRFGDDLFVLARVGLSQGVKVICLVTPPRSLKLIKQELFRLFDSGSPRHFLIKLVNFCLSNRELRCLISSRYICLWMLKA